MKKIIFHVLLACLIFNTIKAQNLDCSIGKFYDPGGASNNYSNNVSKFTQIKPTTVSDRVVVTFTSFDIGPDGDYLNIYDGLDSNSPLIGKFFGTELSGKTIKSTDPSSGALSFRFVSNSFTTHPGWVANVACEPKPNCYAPTGVTSTYVGVLDATISWTPKEVETSWKVEYGVSGFTPGNGTVVEANESQKTISGLLSNTSYDVYIYTNCDEGGISDISNKYTFKTFVNYCEIGKFYDTGGPTNTYGDNENYTVIMKPTTLEDRVVLTFNDLSVFSGDSITVYDGPDTDSTILFNGSGVATDVTFKSRHPSGALTVKFVSDDWIVSSGWDADVSCVKKPDCLPPTNILSSDITNTTATIDWTPVGEESSWTIEYGILGFTQGTGTVVNTTTKPIVLSGLMANKNYSYYVTTNCNVGGESDSSYRKEFTTLLDCYPPTNIISSNITNTTATIDWTPVGEESSWTIEYGVNGFTPGTGTIVNTTTKPIVLTNLTEFTSYSYYIKTNCDEGGQSSVSSVNTFLTKRNCYPPNNVVISNLTGGTATLDWTPVGEESSWTIEYGVAGFIKGTGTIINTTTKPIVLTGLNENTNYNYYITTNCDEGGQSYTSYSNGFWSPQNCYAPTNVVSTNITSKSVTLDWTAVGVESSWSIEYGKPGFVRGTGTVVNTTTKPFVLTNLESDTRYILYIKTNCDEGDQSDSASVFNFTTILDCDSVKFYDSGGALGNYSNNESWTKTITTSQANTIVSVLFNVFNLHTNWDFLKIYDGPNTASPLIGSYSGTSLVGQTIKSTHTSGALTFNFTSGSTVNTSGWEADIICESLLSINGYDKISGLKIYPNPNNGEFNINLDNGLINNIKVYSTTGQLVFEEKHISKSEYSVKLPSHLSSNIYFLKIETERGVAYEKIVKN